jgi:hypothetical protein
VHKLCIKGNTTVYRTGQTLRPLAHTPAFCRNRIRLRSWSFSHVPALPMPVTSTGKMFVHRNRKSKLLVLLYLRHRQVLRHVCKFQFSYIETDKPPGARLVEFKSGTLTCRTWPDRLRVNIPIYLHCIRRRSWTRLRFCRCVCKRP